MQNGLLVSFPISPTVEKLVKIAGGNPFLVVEAVRFCARCYTRTQRCGFLWLKTKTVMYEEADLESVVEYIQRRMAPQETSPA